MHSQIARNFRYARSAGKLVFFETNTLGGRPKMKEFLKNLDSTWSGKFFDEKSMKLQWENRGFDPQWPNSGQKWSKIDPYGRL